MWIRMNLLQRYYLGVLPFADRQTEGCSGADITALCRDAGMQAMYEDLNATEIKRSHFDTALKAMVRSIGVPQLSYFEEFRLHSGVQSIT